MVAEFSFCTPSAPPLTYTFKTYRDLSERAKIKWFLHGLAILASGSLLESGLKARWFTLLGRQCLRSHRLEFALKNFRKSAEQEPNNLHTAIEIAWCLHKLKDYAAARGESAVRPRRQGRGVGVHRSKAESLYGRSGQIRRRVWPGRVWKCVAGLPTWRGVGSSGKLET